MKQRIVRTFEFKEWELRSDGRTMEGVIVPFNEVATIYDRDETTGEIVKFQEQFLPGSCTTMEQVCKSRTNAGWISLFLEHDETLDNRLGCARQIWQTKEGAVAEFALAKGRDLEKVRSILEDSHNGLSVKFRDIAKPKLIDGIVSRVQVYVDHVAATPMPAYTGAIITGMRDSDEGDMVFPTPALDEVSAWLETAKAVHA